MKKLLAPMIGALIAIGTSGVVHADAFDPAAVPLKTRTEALNKFLASYMASATPKALVLTGDRRSVFGYWGQASNDEAVRRALQICEWRSKAPCALYAIGNEVQPKQNGDWPAQPTIKYGPWNFRPADAYDIPFLTEESQKKVMNTAAQSASSSALIVITPTGQYWYWVSGLTRNSGAGEELLDQCRTTLGERGKIDCLVFARNSQVILEKPQ